MTHPVVGIWKVEVALEGATVVAVTHTYFEEGICRITAARHGADILWEATGERTFRIYGTRPIDEDDRGFIGWQTASGDGEVSEDGKSYTLDGATDHPLPDGGRMERRAVLTATRIEFPAG